MDRHARLLSRSAFSSLGQPIEIASQDVQPRLDGWCCHSFCGPAGLGGFLAIMPRRQRWLLSELVHEPQRSRARGEVRASQRRPAHAARSIITSHAIRAMGDRGAGTANLGVRPFDPLALPLSLLITRVSGSGPASASRDAQPRQRQQITERIDHPLEQAQRPINHRPTAWPDCSRQSSTKTRRASRPASARVQYFRCARSQRCATGLAPRRSGGSGPLPALACPE